MDFGGKHLIRTRHQLQRYCCIERVDFLTAGAFDLGESTFASVPEYELGSKPQFNPWGYTAVQTLNTALSARVQYGAQTAPGSGSALSASGGLSQQTLQNIQGQLNSIQTELNQIQGELNNLQVII